MQCAGIPVSSKNIKMRNSWLLMIISKLKNSIKNFQISLSLQCSCMNVVRTAHPNTNTYAKVHTIWLYEWSDNPFAQFLLGHNILYKPHALWPAAGIALDYVPVLDMNYHAWNVRRLTNYTNYQKWQGEQWPVACTRTLIVTKA